MTAGKPRRIAVVGAGISGLPCIRHSLLQGYDVLCFECQENVGGLWRFKPQQTIASVMRSTVSNSSKEMTAYSDFLPAPEEPNFMHNTRLFAYLREYAEHFSLIDHIRFETEVVNIERTADLDVTGKWKVSSRHIKSEEVMSEEFDFVFMATGHHRVPLWPSWPGENEFGGRITHAHDYKDATGYDNKVVVVVGVGNSGGDIACELSRVAKEVHLVARRGTWVNERLSDYGTPYDTQWQTRLQETKRRLLPPGLQQAFLTRALTRRFDHAAYGLEPPNGQFDGIPLYNDDLCSRIACGAVRVMGAISHFDNKSVVFEDSSKIADVDEVILATGYEFDFPMIEKGKLISTVGNKVSLYRFIFPVDLARNIYWMLAAETSTIGVYDRFVISQVAQTRFVKIAHANPQAGVPSITEMQARYALGVFSLTIQLPVKEEMREWVERAISKNFELYPSSPRHTTIVSYLPYMDELAEEVGCAPPSFLSTLLSVPLIAAHLLIAPHAAYFFRLRGPFPWSGARNAILGIADRVAKGKHGAATGSIFTMQNQSFALLVHLALAALLILLSLFAILF